MSRTAECDLCGDEFDPRHEDHVCEPDAIREHIVALEGKVETLEEQVSEQREILARACTALNIEGPKAS